MTEDQNAKNQELEQLKNNLKVKKNECNEQINLNALLNNDLNKLQEQLKQLSEIDKLKK